MSDLLTVIEIAKELRMAPLWVRQKIKAGEIKFIKLGGRYFISKEELERCKKKGVK